MSMGVNVSPIGWLHQYFDMVYFLTMVLNVSRFSTWFLHRAIVSVNDSSATHYIISMLWSDPMSVGVTFV